MTKTAFLTVGIFLCLSAGADEEAVDGTEPAPPPITKEVAVRRNDEAALKENPEEQRAWYMDVFGATERPGNINGIIGADLPGLGLNFSSAAGMAGTAGRVLDHIGFEVDNLEAFCARLEAAGITFDAPYRELPSGFGLAFLTDPWGTYIELTEGLRDVQ